MMTCSNKVFELGERRIVTLRVWLCTGQAFPLSDARWELLTGCASPEASGECEVAQDGDGYTLSAMVQPGSRGNYSIKYSFSVGQELIIRRVPIRVV